jgi:hypothetical protein
MRIEYDGFKVTDTFVPRERISSAFASIYKKTGPGWRDVREGSSSQGRKSRRGLKATWAAVYSYVGLPTGVSAAPRENLRAPSWWGFRGCPNPPPNIFTRTPRNSHQPLFPCPWHIQCLCQAHRKHVRVMERSLSLSISRLLCCSIITWSHVCNIRITRSSFLSRRNDDCHENTCVTLVCNYQENKRAAYFLHIHSAHFQMEK